MGDWGGGGAVTGCRLLVAYKQTWEEEKRLTTAHAIDPASPPATSLRVQSTAELDFSGGTRRRHASVMRSYAQKFMAEYGSRWMTVTLRGNGDGHGL